MKETNFKQSPIGLIPYDWEVVPLHRYADSFIGLTYSPNDVKEFGTLVLRSSNIQQGILDLSDSVFVSCPIPERAKAQDGDILICVRNGSAQLVGKSALITNAMNMAFGAFMTVLRSKSGISNLYLHYFWKSRTLQIQINDNKGNIINQITQANIRDYKLLLPPTLAEQERIAGALSDVDELIATTEALLQKKRDIKQGTMQQLLSGKCRLPGFSDSWITYSVSSDSTVSARIGWQGLTKAEYQNMGDYYIVGGTDFENQRINWKSAKFVSFKRYIEDDKIQIKVGDVLVSKDGTIGKVAYVDYLPKESTLNSGVFVVRSKSNSLLQPFLALIFLSALFSEFISKISAGSTIKHLFQRDIVKFSFTAPKDINEQQAIVKVLTDMDNEIEALENNLAKYKDIREAMMQQLLTGKIRLI